MIVVGEYSFERISFDGLFHRMYGTTIPTNGPRGIDVDEVRLAVSAEVRTVGQTSRQLSPPSLAFL